MHKFFESVIRVFEKQKENARKPREYAPGQMLYPSEIHLLMLIGLNPDVSVTRLADIAGVTKGAVSQTLAKLEAKKLVKREEDADNASRIRLNLTNRGMKSHLAHIQMHKDMHDRMMNFLQGLSKSRFETLEQFFVLMEELVDSMK